MKETVNVNIGSQAFVLDDDAYTALKSYLDDIRCRLPENDTETMGDIESRIAEIFREKISSPMLVVTLDTVRSAMTQMGSPADFGELPNGTVADQSRTSDLRKLYRSRTDRSIAGVCGGIAEFFNIDPSLVRIITLLLMLCFGLSVWVYIILWIVIPEAPAPKFDIHKKRQ